MRPIRRSLRAGVELSVVVLAVALFSDQHAITGEIAAEAASASDPTLYAEGQPQDDGSAPPNGFRPRSCNTTQRGPDRRRERPRASLLTAGTAGAVLRQAATRRARHRFRPISCQGPRESVSVESGRITRVGVSQATWYHCSSLDIARLAPTGPIFRPLSPRWSTGDYRDACRATSMK